MIMVCDSCHEQKQKFEEIKQMAFEILNSFCVTPPKILNKGKEVNQDIEELIKAAWKTAEKFYDYAKTKEEEIENEK